MNGTAEDFPSFSEGLSLRAIFTPITGSLSRRFPFLFGGTFIEGSKGLARQKCRLRFPFLFGGTFIEGVDNVQLDIL